MGANTAPRASPSKVRPGQGQCSCCRGCSEEFCVALAIQKGSLSQRLTQNQRELSPHAGMCSSHSTLSSPSCCPSFPRDGKDSSFINPHLWGKYLLLIIVLLTLLIYPVCSTSLCSVGLTCSICVFTWTDPLPFPPLFFWLCALFLHHSSSLSGGLNSQRLLSQGFHFSAELSGEQH